MICPKCGYEQYCFCSNCAHKIPEGMMPEIPTELDGEDAVQCANCGFTESVSWWLDYEWDIAVEGGCIERPPEYSKLYGYDGIEINYI